jgi:ubiquitin C-terminal hydrolase
MTEQYFKYKLMGVVVHNGTSESGHYYSFIKDREKK